MIIKAQIKVNSTKSLVYARLDHDLAMYYTWLASKENGIQMNLPRIGSHVTLVNGKFDKINRKVFNKAAKGAGGDLFLNLDMTQLRFQKGGGGAFRACYLFFKSGEVFRSVREKYGVDCDKNFKAHLTLCNTKGMSHHLFSRSGGKYFNSFVDKSK